MEIANGKSRQAENRANPFLGFFWTLRSAVKWLARLVILTEEERIQAGIYYGNERHE